MTAKSVLMRPQGLRPRARAPTCPPSCYATARTGWSPGPQFKGCQVKAKDFNTFKSRSFFYRRLLHFNPPLWY